MIRAAQQSINTDGMLDASVRPSATAPANEFHKLDDRMKKILQQKNPIPGPHHPTYLTMIKSAVLALNESKGASKPAILKYLAQHYQLGENLPKINSHLCLALRKALKDGNIEQTKGHGASGSFKMSSVNMKRASIPKPAPKKSASKPAQKAKEEPKMKMVAVKVTDPRKAMKTSKKSKVAKVVKKTTKKTAAKKSVSKPKPRVQKKRGPTKIKKTPRAKRA